MTPTRLTGLDSAANDDGHGQVVRTGSVGHFGNGFLDGVHVFDRDFVGERGSLAVAGVLEFAVDQVRADAFDLGNDVALAGERDGDDQNDAGAADDDAEHGQHGAHFIGTQRLQGEAPGFTPKQRRTP